MSTTHFDVAVVGAGPAGAFAAELLAATGLKIALIDQKPAGKTGAQWLNGVPLWMLEQAGLGRPPEEQIFAEFPSSCGRNCAARRN